MNLVKFAPARHPFAHLFDHVHGQDAANSENWNYSPAVNILQAPEGYRIDVALPGYSKEDISMKVDNGLVTVSSQKEAEKLSENSQFTRREFGLGTFERSFSIPKSIDTDKISAHFNNGILSIALPKREESLPKPARSVEIL